MGNSFKKKKPKQTCREKEDTKLQEGRKLGAGDSFLLLKKESSSGRNLSKDEEG